VTGLQKRGDKLRLLTDDPTQTLRQLWGVIEDQGLEPVTLNTLGSSLEDAFLQLTGTEMEAEVIKRRRGR
jgi:ABC-2 type transport system ATP-binding protein